MTSYWTAHERMGRAADHQCTCGAPAKDWALLSGRGTRREIVQGRELVYSEDPSDYTPLCRACHSALDNNRPTRSSDLAIYSRGGKIGGPAAARVTNSKRVECLECGKISSPGPLSLHQSKLGHNGKKVL